MENRINNDRYNALVRVFARAKEALRSESDVENFTTPVRIEMYSQLGKFSSMENFNAETFLDDVRAFSLGSGSTFAPRRKGDAPPAPVCAELLSELVCAFKNRAPVLGEKFELLVETNKLVAKMAVVFLIAEYLYLDRAASYRYRESANEAFRLAMFEAHAEPLYIAAFNTIRSYAASMARAVLAADVAAAIGGGDNAN
jgi:hypothetical protein